MMLQRLGRLLCKQRHVHSPGLHLEKAITGQLLLLALKSESMMQQNLLGSN